MKVAIVHPWFPQYRKPFFDELIRMGLSKGIEIDVFYGSPPPEWSARGDSITEDYATHLRTRFLGLAGKHLVFKSPLQVWRSGPYDLMVLEQAVRNVETYAFLLRPRKTHIAFWGHGKTYTSAVSSAQERVKGILTRQGEWFFAYTAGGSRAVIDAGFPREKVTVVQNSIDTKALQREINSITDKDRKAFETKHDLLGRTGLFIGGLDESKRLDFLIESADAVYARDTEFRMMIIGSGVLKEFVERAAHQRPWMTYLGSLFGKDKALAMAAANLLLMPGRVGLVAVDSFASSTPIVTTDWTWHAPEFEYLENGHNAVITADDVSAYSEAVSDILSRPEVLKRLALGASESALTFTVSAMATNFIDGLARWRNDTNRP